MNENEKTEKRYQDWAPAGPGCVSESQDTKNSYDEDHFITKIDRKRRESGRSYQVDGFVPEKEKE